MTPTNHVQRHLIHDDRVHRPLAVRRAAGVRIKECPGSNERLAQMLAVDDVAKSADKHAKKQSGRKQIHHAANRVAMPPRVKGSRDRSSQDAAKQTDARPHRYAG